LPPDCVRVIGAVSGRIGGRILLYDALRPERSRQSLDLREVPMLDGVMLLWFLLTAASLLFVAVDIRATPESPVLKWGFVLLTAYTGVGGRVPLRARLPRAAAGAARALRRCALAAGAGIDDALRCW
jgi:hypothetical protein